MREIVVLLTGYDYFCPVIYNLRSQYKLYYFK